MTKLRTSQFFTLDNAMVVPRGIEAVFEYNGLIMNDRRYPDIIRVQSATGLTTDADVRDSRELNANRHGETPGPALYGGKTITLRGQVEAGNLDALRYLWNNMKLAFDALEELPLHIRWYDWRERFRDTSTFDDYAIDEGAGTMSPSESGLLFSTTALKQFYLNLPVERFNRHNRASVVRFKRNSAASSGFINPLAKRVDEDTWVGGFLDVGGGTWTIGHRLMIDGVQSSGTIIVTAPPVGVSVWLYSKLDGTIIETQIFASDPLRPDPRPLSPLYRYQMGSEEIDALGESVDGAPGIRIQPFNNGLVIEDWDSAAMHPGDLIAMCRKVQSIEGEEAQTNDRYQRSFMLTLRSGSDSLLSRVAYRSDKKMGLGMLRFPEDGSGLTFPLDGSGLQFGNALEGTIVNMGNSKSYPIIRFYGEQVNPVVFNKSNGTLVALNYTLGPQDEIFVDSKKRRVYDSFGRRLAGARRVDSGWLELDSGQNQIFSGGDDISATGRVEIVWRDEVR